MDAILNHLTLAQLDDICNGELDVIVTYNGGWNADEDEYDYINKPPKGVRIA